MSHEPGIVVPSFAFNASNPAINIIIDVSLKFTGSPPIGLYDCTLRVDL